MINLRTPNKNNFESEEEYEEMLRALLEEESRYEDYYKEQQCMRSSESLE